MAWISVVFPDPRSPEKPMIAGARSSRPKRSPNWLSSSTCSRTPTSPWLELRLQLEQLIPQQRSQLEVECFGGGLHLRFEQPDHRVPLGGIGRAPHWRLRHPTAAGIRHAGHESDVAD